MLHGASVPARPCCHNRPAATAAVLVRPPNPRCSWAIRTAIYIAIPMAVLTAIPSAVYTTTPIVVPFAIPSAISAAIPIAIHFAIPSALPTVVPFASPTASPSRTSGLALLPLHYAWGLSQPQKGPWQRLVLRDERDSMTFFFFFQSTIWQTS